MNRSKNLTTERHSVLDAGELGRLFPAFAARLRERGYRPLTIEGYEGSAAHFGHWLTNVGIPVADIGDDVLCRFAAHRCRCPGGRRTKSVSARYVARVRCFVTFLSERGLVRDIVSRPSRSRAPEPIPAFCAWLRQHRGLSEWTVTRYERWLVCLVGLLGENTAHYTAKLVRETVITEAQHRSPSVTSDLVNALRVYLRYLAVHGRCRPGLDAAVPTFARWRLSTLPRYLDSNDVERVIEACDLSRPVGVRDRAILLLLARLGLRAGDIVALCLSDIDWQAATLGVRAKSRREVRLPLPQDAGDAILEYLERGRPASTVPQIFLCAQAPLRPLQTPSLVSSIVSAALRRAQITDPPSRGAHLLRHSAATTMLRAGASLDAIGAVLRHRSSDTTVHYAKVDQAMLAPLAQPWPEGVSC